jgi:hypothetical protein
MLPGEVGFDRRMLGLIGLIVDDCGLGGGEISGECILSEWLLLCGCRFVGFVADNGRVWVCWWKGSDGMGVGVLSFAQDDGGARATVTTAARANTGVSPLRRQSAPPPVEMTCFLGAVEDGQGKNNGNRRSLRDDKQKDRQQQRQQQQATAPATATAPAQATSNKQQHQQRHQHQHQR